MPQGLQGLGMGLGLGPQKQNKIRQAAAGGTLDQFLANRPQLSAKIQNRATGATGNALQQANAQGWMQAAKPAPQQGQAAPTPQPAAPQANAPQAAPATPPPPTPGGEKAGGKADTVGKVTPQGGGLQSMNNLGRAGGALTNAQTQSLQGILGQMGGPGAPGAGQGMSQGAGAGAGTPAMPGGGIQGGQSVNQPTAGGPATTAGAPGSPYEQALASQFGAGNPFGNVANPTQQALAGGEYQPQSWYGDNPLLTAQNLANRNLQKQLGETRARFGAGGMGNSSRAALAEGTALGESATGLGDVMASRGIGARSEDLTRRLQAQSTSGQQSLQQAQLGLESMLGAGAQDLQAKQLGLNANQQLTNAGAGLTGIGTNEMTPANLGGLISSILGMGGGRNLGGGAVTGQAK